MKRSTDERCVRRVGAVSLSVAVVCAAGSVALRRGVVTLPTVGGVDATGTAATLLTALTVAFAAYGAFKLLDAAVVARAPNKRRSHDARTVLRLAFGLAALLGILGALTEQWVGVLFSLGVVGFAVTFALQQPLFSLIGWFYVTVKRPYAVGDRIAIEGTKGDVVDVDFFVTTLWEIDGELVASNQPSGRIVTLPNSVVLSAHVHNYSWQGFPFVWNEISIQVAYETDLQFATDLLQSEADDMLGDEMAERVERYRQRLSETPVELEVRERPTVNVRQQESWVELRLRYLVHPRRGQRVKNELYERVLEAFNDHPDRVKFPVSRNR